MCGLHIEGRDVVSRFINCFKDVLFIVCDHDRYAHLVDLKKPSLEDGSSAFKEWNGTDIQLHTSSVHILVQVIWHLGNWFTRSQFV